MSLPKRVISCATCKFGIFDVDPNQTLEPEDKLSCFLHPPVLICMASETWNRPPVARSDFCSKWETQE